MRRFLLLFCIPLLASCADSSRLPHETDVQCIHRFYDLPARSEPFQTAASTCAGDRTVDLTGDRYYQLLASRLNLPFVAHDPKNNRQIVLTGSRLAQPTDEPPPPQISFH